MPIYLFLNVFDLQLLQVKLHFFAILCNQDQPLESTLPLHQYILNFKARLAGCAWAFCPIVFTLIAIVDLALGGRSARKLRAVLPERALNGEKEAVTEVMYLVSIFGSAQSSRRSSGQLHMRVSEEKVISAVLLLIRALAKNTKVLFRPATFEELAAKFDFTFDQKITSLCTALTNTILGRHAKSSSSLRPRDT